MIQSPVTASVALSGMISRFRAALEVGGIAEFPLSIPHPPFRGGGVRGMRRYRDSVTNTYTTYNHTRSDNTARQCGMTDGPKIVV